MGLVMITGASRGIGLELVRQYLADGYKVYATCHKVAGAEHLMALPSNGRGKIDVMEMDVTNAAQVKAVAKRLSGVPIDVLINNTGTVEPIFYGSGAYEGNDDPDLRNYDFDAWLELLETNVLGPARSGAQCAHPQYRRMVREARHHSSIDFAGLEPYRAVWAKGQLSRRIGKRCAQRDRRADNGRNRKILQF